MAAPVLTENPEAPAEERRGGEEGTDWGQVHPGEPFPDPRPAELPETRFAADPRRNGHRARRPQRTLPNPRRTVGGDCDADGCEPDDLDVVPLYSWCGTEGCGGD